MKTIVTTTYQCEVCQREWDDKSVAQTCEASPGPALQPGDVVLWRGSRDPEYGGQQAVVYDTVKAVEVHLRGPMPGHRVEYGLNKNAIIPQTELRAPRHGYVTIAGTFRFAPMHSDQMGTALRETPGTLAPVVEHLQRTGLPFQERLVKLYPALRELQYGMTWTPREVHALPLHRLTAAEAEVLTFITREPTDDECLGFVGGFRYSQRTPQAKTDLGDAFDHNHYAGGWGAMLGFDFNLAFSLIATKTTDEIIQRVRDYHAIVLRGEAGLSWQPQSLFHLDPARATGVWPKPILAWAKDHGVTGAGETRLRRTYEAIFKALKDPHRDKDTIMIKKLTLFEDKTVIAVMSGKGGVGKSTVSSTLARTLAAAGHKTLIVDFDFWGPSVPALFPVEDPRLKTADGLIVPHIVDGVEVFSVGYLLNQGEALEWRGPHVESGIHALCSHLKTDAEIVVIDLPPGTSDVMYAVDALVPHAAFVVVTTAGDVALNAVARSIEALSYIQRQRVIGVIENMAYFMAGDQRFHLWGPEDSVPDLAKRYTLRYLGQLPMINEVVDRAAYVQAVADLLRPQAERALTGDLYQTVDLAVIEQAAIEMIRGKLGDRANWQAGGIRMVTTRRNIANTLNYAIVMLGGNPVDPRYRDTLQAQFQRVLTALAAMLVDEHTLPSSEVAPAGDWWKDLPTMDAENAAEDRDSENEAEDKDGGEV